MSRILITGGDGFIGRHLVDEFVEVGHHVATVDWSSEKEWNQKPSNDLRQPDIFAYHLEQFEPDVVVHLAAQVGRLFGEDDLIFTVQENAQMTTLVANATAKYGAKLMYASTSEVYGDWGNLPVHERCAGQKTPVNLYGLTKYWGETVCNMYWNMYERDPSHLSHLRFSMPYGVGVVPGRGRAALLNMLWQSHNRLPIPVHADSGRSWCWIGDTVRAVRMILDSEKGGAWNIGRDNNFTTMQAVAEMACDIAGAPYDLIKQVAPTHPQISDQET